MALSLFAKLLMMERDSWKRELPVSATSEISWLTAIMTWTRSRIKWRDGYRGKEGERSRVDEGKKKKPDRIITTSTPNALNGTCIDGVQ